MKKLAKATGTCSLLLNMMPFLLYVSLTKQQSDVFIGALPFAIYYAFRHTSLLIFRDLAHDYQRLAWLGVYCGIIGYFLGIWGSYYPLLWDLSAVGVGISSQLFPTAVSQRKRLVKRGLLPATETLNPALQIICLLLVVGLVSWVDQPIVTFGIMLVVSLCAAASIWSTPRALFPRPVHRQWMNYILALILLTAMLLLRLGRSLGIGEPVEWGTACILAFLVVLGVALFLNRDHLHRYPGNLRLRIMLYGACGQYWTLYSTVFIGVLYGIKLYDWTIVAYLLAFVGGGIVAKGLQRLVAVQDYRLNLALIVIGILLTFWLPTYFIGIFIIRSFAGAERQRAIADYEEATHHYDISYIVNYYYASIAGLVSQLVMWGSLFLLAGSRGMNQLFSSLSAGRVSSSGSGPITTTHLILAVYMILVVSGVAIRARNQQEKDN